MTQYGEALIEDGFVHWPGLLSADLVDAMGPVVDNLVGTVPRGRDAAQIKANSRVTFPFIDLAASLACLAEPLLDAVGELLGVAAPVLCESTLYARFGAADIVGVRESTTFHTHWDGSALAPPEPSPRAGALAVNVFWYETDASNAPMLLVRRPDAPGGARRYPDVAAEELAGAAAPAYGKPGDVLFYELDTYHMSSGFLDRAARRVTHRIVFADPACTWVCRKLPAAADPGMDRLLRAATPRQLSALGVPPRLGAYWATGR